MRRNGLQAGIAALASLLLVSVQLGEAAHLEAVHVVCAEHAGERIHAGHNAGLPGPSRFEAAEEADHDTHCSDRMAESERAQEPNLPASSRVETPLRGLRSLAAAGPLSPLTLAPKSSPPKQLR